MKKIPNRRISQSKGLEVEISNVDSRKSNQACMAKEV